MSLTVDVPAAWQRREPPELQAQIDGLVRGPRRARPTALGSGDGDSRPRRLSESGVAGGGAALDQSSRGPAPLPAVQIGRHRRFYRSELERWLARQRA